MDVHITSQEMIPREIKVKNEDEGKRYILDIKAKIERKDNKGGTYEESVNIEMQRASEKGFGTRVLQYALRMLDEGSKIGQDSSQLPSVYSLVFTTTNLHNYGRKEHCIHYMYTHSRRDHNYGLTDKMEIVVVELAKINRGLDPELSPDMEDICELIRYSKDFNVDKSKFDELLKRGGKKMEKALEAYVELSEDEELKALQEAKDLEDLKEANRRAYAVDEALKEERKKAAHDLGEERKKTALGLLEDGVSITIIQKNTGLSEEEIKNLKKS